MFSRSSARAGKAGRGANKGSWTNAQRDERPVVLHVGCGTRQAEGLHPDYRGGAWREVRLDINPGVDPDIVADIAEMTPVESQSVDAVWSSHNIEHVYAHRVPLVLNEFMRVLRPGGHVHIVVPDLQYAAERIVKAGLEKTAFQSLGGPITPLDLLYGHGAQIENGEGNEFMAHRTGFTAGTLERKLRVAGFAAVAVDRGEEGALHATARRRG